MDECKQVVKEIATPDKDDADYSSVTTTTVMEQFHMNWGWGGTSDGYFGLLPEDWDESQGAPYDYEAAMLYNFEQI